MSEVWRLQTKTEVSKKNKLENEVAKYCKDNKLIALGWTLKEDIYNSSKNKKEIDNKAKNIKEFSDYEKIIKEYNFFDDKKGKNNINNVKRLNCDLTKNKEKQGNENLIWLKLDGEYYLAKISKDSKYIYNQDSYVLNNLGASNQLTNIKWHKIGDESDIPGCISTSFIRGQALQRIQKDIALKISQILYNKYIESGYYLTTKIKNNSKNFYSLLSPKDCEDLLYFCFYHKFKYVAIPSTNKTNTQTYEFVMLSPKNRERKIYIQVKNGDSEKTDLYLESFNDLDGKVYLLTTDGKIYENKEKKDKKETLQIEFKNNSFMERIGTTNSNKKIYAVNPEALFEFAQKAYKDKSILMPHSILQWFEYLE
ncbi:hypothetical protein [Fusobacterium canifelinum]|uniref:Uncharacterized protein n=1 Tax=Fusobacterium canifelinum TaxID=285729 RepID=A0ABX7CFT1_9FUSO|nr:hypothetical protein [Fusobacterium canifelinum]QQS88386.1 hypothetical protein I6I83_04425 [Fusobacterium canifelinum]